MSTYYPTQYQAWSRTSPNDGAAFQSEFAQLYSNTNYILAATLAGAVVGNSNGNIPLSNGTVNTNLNAQYHAGAALSTDGTMASDSDILVPSQKAVVTYVNGNGGILPVGAVIDYVGNNLPSSSWAFCDGSAISRTTFATLWGIIQTTIPGTATTTLSTNTLFSLTGNPLTIGDCVSIISTTGALGTGLATETQYFVTTGSSGIAGTVVGTTFKLSSTFAGALAGTSLVGTTAGTGNITMRWNPLGIPAGGTSFNIPDLRGIGTIGDGQQGYNTGWGTLSYYLGKLGQYIQDQGQVHVHRAYSAPTQNFTNISFGGGSGTAFATNPTDNYIPQPPTTDGAHGTPRAGYITQGPVLALKKIIRVI